MGKKDKQNAAESTPEKNTAQQPTAAVQAAFGIVGVLLHRKDQPAALWHLGREKNAHHPRRRLHQPDHRKISRQQPQKRPQYHRHHLPPSYARS